MGEAPLQGKTIVVTGATGRLGSRLLDLFGKRGARLAALVRLEEEAARVRFGPGVQGRVFIGDTGIEADVERLFQEVQRDFGRIDALVHSVGMWDGRPFLNTSVAEWESLMRINLTSVFLTFREAARAMRGGPGRLIGFAAAQGADRGRPQQAAYSASKAGVVRLVEAVAAELSGSGVTAHAVAPSTILYGEEGSDVRGVTAEALADLCTFLCSEAGAALNGQTIRAYGTAG